MENTITNKIQKSQKRRGTRPPLLVTPNPTYPSHKVGIEHVTTFYRFFIDIDYSYDKYAHLIIKWAQDFNIEHAIALYKSASGNIHLYIEVKNIYIHNQTLFGHKAHFVIKEIHNAIIQSIEKSTGLKVDASCRNNPNHPVWKEETPIPQKGGKQSTLKKSSLYPTTIQTLKNTFLPSIQSKSYNFSNISINEASEKIYYEAIYNIRNKAALVKAAASLIIDHQDAKNNRFMHYRNPIVNNLIKAGLSIDDIKSIITILTQDEKKAETDIKAAIRLQVKNNNGKKRKISKNFTTFREQATIILNWLNKQKFRHYFGKIQPILKGFKISSSSFYLIIKRLVKHGYIKRVFHGRGGSEIWLLSMPTQEELKKLFKTFNEILSSIKSFFSNINNINYLYSKKGGARGKNIESYSYIEDLIKRKDKKKLAQVLLRASLVPFSEI